MSLMQDYLEHPEDVLGQWLAWRAESAAALVVMTATEGGAVRERGAGGRAGPQRTPPPHRRRAWEFESFRG